MYYDAFHCLPNRNNYHTVILNNIYDDERTLFCANYLVDNITKLERNINYHCNQLCGSPCHQVFHDVEIEFSYHSPKILTINFYFIDATFRSIEYEPKISMMEFLINLFNIWNLWHGTSLITILLILTNFSKKTLRFFIIPTNCLNMKLLIKIISSILLLLFTEKIISLTINYLQYDTITKINLLDYEDDANYPYLSFTLKENIKYLMVHLANFKSNFTLYSKNNFSKYEESLKSSIFKNDSEIFETQYSSLYLIEVLVNGLNISKQDLFNQEYFRNYCFKGVSLYIFNGNYLLTNMNEHNLSYSTIFE